MSLIVTEKSRYVHLVQLSTLKLLTIALGTDKLVSSSYGKRQGTRRFNFHHPMKRGLAASHHSLGTSYGDDTSESGGRNFTIEPPERARR